MYYVYIYLLIYLDNNNSCITHPLISILRNSEVKLTAQCQEKNY